jgi:Outer membrane protein beta-barrel domain
MKKLFVIVFLFISCASLQAQTKKQSSSGAGFGIRAGFNLQNINGRDFNDNKLENKLVPRFHAGVYADLPLADEFFVQPGVLFATKGTKFKGSNTILNLSYIEIPVNLLFKPELGSGRLLLGFGPYVAYGVSGKLKPESGNLRSITFKKEISPSEFLSGNYLRAFDAGANLAVGYELSSKLSVQLNAQLGLVNIYPDIDGVTNSKTNYKNTGFGLSVGYRIN